ncbi:ATP-dependent DNA helicase UvrD/PcrA [Mucinivorans hirudinis]|uniref:DNA 3'-5' helicase n=1 Tax=Mucinivorans hirudinis TaxID=1433126 RepID=A0A060RET1_9BACT|nr:ATP-dependent DNA helicase UvrD/PcrA [Mucinivorans hirudinis]
MKNIQYISAGAGSGKTYRLTEILSERLSSGFCTPSEIILTTYTKAAANEFKTKARRRLIEDNKLIEATELDNAKIGTVHSIANIFVNRYWYLLGRGAVANVISQSDKNFYINQSLAEIVTAKQIRNFAELREEFNFWIKAEGKSDAFFWREHLSKVIEVIDSYDIESLELSRQRSIEMIDTVFLNDVAKCDYKSIVDFLTQAKLVVVAAGKQKNIDDALNGKTDNYAFLLSAQGVLKKFVDKDKAELTLFNSTADSINKQLRGTLFGEKLKKYISVIFELAQRWKEKYKEYKQKNNLIDYNDMERIFLELLQNDVVKSEIQSDYKLLLVDEFQDSNPIQIKIFDILSELVEETIWVGDPKQAIYGFRGSDAELIDKVSEAFPSIGEPANAIGLSRDKLHNSHRSRGKLVNMTNSIFASVFSADIDLHLIPKREKDEFNSAPTTLHFESSERKKSDHFAALSQKICELLAGKGVISQVLCSKSKTLRPINAGDIAILANSNNDVDSIAAACRECGLKVSTAESDIMQFAEIQLIEAILNYSINGKGDDFSKAEILYLMNSESVEDILSDRLSYIEEREEDTPKWRHEQFQIAKIDSFIVKCQNQSVSEYVESLVLELDICEIIKRWGDYNRRKGHIDTLQQMAKAYEDRALQLGLGSSINGFLVYLSSTNSNDNPFVKADGAISVLTYHKSKGLEWNVVVLESLENDSIEEQKLLQKGMFGVQNYRDEQSTELYAQRYITLFPYCWGASNVPAEIAATMAQTPLFLKKTSTILNEQKRLMYVGITRARDFVITSAMSKNEKKWFQNIGIDEDQWSTHSHIIPISKGDEFIPLNCEPYYTEYVKEAKERRYEPKFISPSQINKPIAAEPQIVYRSGQRISIANEDMANIGTCLHNIFAIYEQDATDNVAKAKRIISSLEMSAAIPSEVEVIGSMDNLYSYLTATYGTPKAIHKERAVIMELGEQVLNGSIDLAWEWEDGTVIVDYKSFPGREDIIMKEGGDHYAGNYLPQLVAYQSILESSNIKVLDTLIYYAVQGVVVKF